VDPSHETHTELLHQVLESFLKKAQPLLQATGSNQAFESVTRVPYEYSTDGFLTVDLVTLSPDIRTGCPGKYYFKSTWQLDKSGGPSICCSSSEFTTHGFWWRQLRQKLRNNQDIVQHSVECLHTARPRVQFMAELATVHCVERFELAEIVGEWREPEGENPSYYHLAQSRVRRLQRFGETLECEMLGALLQQWRGEVSRAEPSTWSEYDDPSDDESYWDDESSDDESYWDDESYSLKLQVQGGAEVSGGQDEDDGDGDDGDCDDGLQLMVDFYKNKSKSVTEILIKKNSRVIPQESDDNACTMWVSVRRSCNLNANNKNKGELLEDAYVDHNWVVEEDELLAHQREMYKTGAGSHGNGKRSRGFKITLARNTQIAKRAAQRSAS